MSRDHPSPVPAARPPGFASADARSVVVVGTGGFVLEICDYLRMLDEATAPALLGCIDPGSEASPARVAGLPVLGRLDALEPAAGLVAIVAVGHVRHRGAIFDRLREKSIAAPAFVAPGALVSASATLDDGAIVCPLAFVAAGAAIGRGAVVNVHCSVGHGASVGGMSVLSPYVALSGDARVGAGCFLGTRATLHPRVSIGDGCVVDSHAAVRADAPARQMISSRGRYLVSRLRGA